MLRKDVRFHDPGLAVTQHDIDWVKEALGGIALPLDYERYLLRFNGAQPIVSDNDLSTGQLLRIWWPADTVADTTDHAALLGSIHEVQGRPERAADLLETHQNIGHLLPPDTVAFARGAGGSCFLFDLRLGRFGEVLYWRYGALEDEATFGANPFHNVGWVAKDFIEFINRIELEPDDFDAWEASLQPDAAVAWCSR